MEGLPVRAHERRSKASKVHGRWSVFILDVPYQLSLICTLPQVHIARVIVPGRQVRYEVTCRETERQSSIEDGFYGKLKARDANIRKQCWSEACHDASVAGD